VRWTSASSHLSLVVSIVVIASPIQRQASSNWLRSAWAFAKFDKTPRPPVRFLSGRMSKALTGAMVRTTTMVAIIAFLAEDERRRPKDLQCSETGALPYANSSSSAFASIRSRVSKPSVNQP
jgi:hypothetical protein